MKKERRVKGKGFNLDSDVLAAKETGCAGILAMGMFVARGMFVMIVCQFDHTQQQDIAT